MAFAMSNLAPRHAPPRFYHLPSAIRYRPTDAFFLPVSSLMRFPIRLLMC